MAELAGQRRGSEVVVVARQWLVALEAVNVALGAAPGVGAEASLDGLAELSAAAGTLVLEVLVGEEAFRGCPGGASLGPLDFLGRGAATGLLIQGGVDSRFPLGPVEHARAEGLLR